MSRWSLSVELILAVANSLVMIITLTILIWQTRELTRQTEELIRGLELSSVEDITDKLYRVYEIMINNPNLAKAVGSKEFTSEKAFVYLVLDLYEMAYKQYKRGVLDNDDWQGWLAAIEDSFESQIFQKHWFDAREVGSPEFVQYMEERIKNKS